ncbi:MAG: Regulators of stationary/sporulation expression protein [Rhizobium sp.]|nr:Regulators of stationary/sporulation expression protein [Rhizobium sp.]
MGVFYATLTSKGQTTVPAEVRELLNLKPGDRIRYVTDGDRVYIRVKNKRAADLAGLLHDPNRAAMSIEEMDDAIGKYVAEDDKRIADDWNRHEHSSPVHSRR